MNTNSTPPVTVTTTTPQPATDGSAPVSVTVTVTLAPPVIATASSPPPPPGTKVPAAPAIAAPAASPNGESTPAQANPKAMVPAPEPVPQPAKPATTAPEPVPPAVPSLLQKVKKWIIPILVIALLAVAALVAWQMLRPKGPGKGFVNGNGRLEATEIDVSAKLAGRIQDILVSEGDFVTAGQILAHMQVQTLEAQHVEAAARLQQSITAVASAEAQVAMRQSDKQAVLALVKQRKSESDAARRRLLRSETLTREGAASAQELDDDRARLCSTEAAVAAAKAQVNAAQAAIVAARTQVVSARSAITAVEATVTRIKADINDSALTAPRDGRVQYRIAQPGEVLAPGGKVLNLVDLADVYMTFFIPEAVAGQLALGSEVHIVLDAAPQYVIPTTVTFVASTAQFTPKTVETASERQKLMFRVKAQIDRELLLKHLHQVKTGLPGVAWVKLDAKAQWPDELATRVPK